LGSSDIAQEKAAQLSRTALRLPLADNLSIQTPDGVWKKDPFSAYCLYLNILSETM
jgi:hypothetical protein